MFIAAKGSKANLKRIAMSKSKSARLPAKAKEARCRKWEIKQAEALPKKTRNTLEASRKRREKINKAVHVEDNCSTCLLMSTNGSKANRNTQSEEHYHRSSCSRTSAESHIWQGAIDQRRQKQDRISKKIEEGIKYKPWLFRPCEFSP